MVQKRLEDLGFSILQEQTPSFKKWVILMLTACPQTVSVMSASMTDTTQ